MAFLVHQLLSEAAAAAPEREALRHRGASWTYAQLEGAANGVACALIQLGVRRGDRVGIVLPKRPEAIAALYGVLKAGAVYVPLDPLAPMPYVATVARDCSIGGLVTTSSRAAGLLPAMGDLPPKGAVLVDEGGADASIPWVSYEDATSDPRAEDPGVPVIDRDLACLMYTSGSTGRPKGVMHTHRALLTAIEWYARKMRVASNDRLIVHAPLHFVLSVYGIFPAALARATSVLISLETAFRGSDLSRIVRDEGVTVWMSVPAPLRALAASPASPGSLPSLRVVVAGGGPLPAGDVPALRALAPNAEIWQFYGSTEAWGVCHHRVDGTPDPSRPLPIGLPQGNTEAFAVRDDGSVAGPGETGELFVRSPKVMKGYWGAAEETARVLVADPRGGERSDLVYRTGDEVRVLEDGGFQYMGRRDQMIKSRGYRIELSEIEAALVTHDSILDAAVIAVPDRKEGTGLAAVVEPREGELVTERELRSHLANRLPSYMVPRRIDVVRELPRTSTGKVDRSRILAELADGTSSPGDRGAHEGMVDVRG